MLALGKVHPSVGEFSFGEKQFNYIGLSLLAKRKSAKFGIPSDISGLQRTSDA